MITKKLWNYWKNKNHSLFKILKILLVLSENSENYTLYYPGPGDKEALLVKVDYLLLLPKLKLGCFRYTLLY